MKKSKKIYPTWERMTLYILGIKPYGARIYRLKHISGNIVYQVKFFKNKLPDKIMYSVEDAKRYAKKGIAFLNRQLTIEFES